MNPLTELLIDGLPLWTVLLISAGVFLASFMDSIAGGGGIISVPVYLIGFHGMPTYYVLGTNKLSSGIGTAVSTARFIRRGYVDWKLALPSVVFAMSGSVVGTWLQHRTPDQVLKYLLLVVLPIVAFFTLRTRETPTAVGSVSFRRQAAIAWSASLIVGAYDGYYGPGAGTFILLILIQLAKMDVHHAAGNARVVCLASNMGSLFTAWRAGYILWGVGLIAAGFSILAHWLGAGLAIKNGSKIVKPTVIIVLILLTAKILSEILFPEFWA